MDVAADLHVHSHWSRATSRSCTLEGLGRWARLKGVRLVGTGDCTHPLWLAEIAEKLEPSAPGLFRLKEAARAAVEEVPPRCRGPVEFVLSGEISSIYKRDGQVRKVHCLVLLPGLEEARRFSEKLDAVGNIRSDGRPILGLDPRDLFAMLLEISPEAVLIPAHIWTPWFSTLGSKSGFDSVEAAFGDLTNHIPAVETGLSSDPPMNYRVSELDRFTLVASSDLHSPANLARNATLFRCEVTYPAIRQALFEPTADTFGGTIDLFPEAGKYHLDGHRRCGVCLEPEESLARDNRCPECGKPLVLGVLHRVTELADRPRGFVPEGAMPYRHLVPLPHLLSELYGVGPRTKTVSRSYHRLLRAVGPELHILRDADPERLENQDPPGLAEAVRRVRVEAVTREPGCDGEYGRIRVFG